MRADRKVGPGSKSLRPERRAVGDESFEEFAVQCAEPHSFGGVWTLDKLDALRKYLAAFAVALKAKPTPQRPFRLLYIDAFAGSGIIEVSVNGETARVPGSAHIALNSSPAFHSLVFIDKDADHCDRLRQLTAGDRRVTVRQGDANAELRDLCRTTDWRGTRAVLFLDPYGLNVEWATLAAVAATKSIDVWYLWPLSGVFRQLARDRDKVDASKAAALTRILGTDTWRDELYVKSATGDLFGGERMERADVPEIQQYVTMRLADLFPTVFKPKTIYYVGPDGQRGAPLFDLYCLISNPAPKAVAAARNIALHILRAM